MEDTGIIYQEEIAPDTVRQMLGREDLGSDDVTCMLISEYCKTVILIHDNKTGKEEEVVLEDTPVEEDLSIPRMENSSKEILGKSASTVILINLAKYVLGIAITVAIVLGVALLFV